VSERVAVVTGAGRRIAIGAAVARRLVADGFAVVLQSWSPHDAEQPWGEDVGGVEAQTEELSAAGGRVVHVAADFADPAAPAALIEAAREAFGHVDVLVAAHARSSEQSLDQLTAAELDLSFAVNTRGTLLLVQALAAQHDGRPGGRVVWFTSGQHASAMPGELPYIASKGALHQVTASVAVPLIARGITVNCIDPGPIDTGWADEETRATVAARHPAGRWSTPEDIARVVGWLVGDDGGWVTGQVINADGGWSVR
jgi:3-oxoacyl-[acyl-carrier protein] reductase